ncbi:MAG: glycoside hydrolase family 3 C-terminal domain-containing protein [Muribaculaceae bacterium]|nr:glycoside hydrolase family 3 C-terminal domain-containing protein [Muribaculaceae bacterium]
MMKKPSMILAAVAVASATSAQLQLRPDNIDEILADMSLEEKAVLLVGGGNCSFGVGENGIIGSTDNMVPGAAGTTVSIPRLGIPATVLTDGPAGVRISPTRKNDDHTYYATGFPVGTALASTWNTELVEEVGRAMGNEVLEYGCDVLLAPGMNIHRSPLCGRNFEYYSEDPVLTGFIAAAFVNGIQSNGVGTSLKHYAANSQETNRMEVDEIVGPRAMREIYLKGFEIAVKDAKPWTVMSSYNRLNGPYTQEDRDLLTTVLRDEWGFDGIVMSDWTGPRHTDAQVHAGNDLMEPGFAAQAEEIVAKVKSGELSEADVDTSVRRMLQYLVKTPHYKGYKYSNTPDLKAHATVTRQSATEGMVLLKNEDHTLPLNGVNEIALFGITSYDFIAGGTGSGDVNKPYVVDLMEGLDNAGLKVTDDMKNMYVAYRTFKEAERAANHSNQGWGKAMLPELAVSRRAIDHQAKIADIAVLTLGRQAGEGHDRLIDNDFNLSAVERQLLDDVADAFHARGKRVVVIINTGAVIETASWKNKADAILLAWQPGQEGGNSVADVLTGKENPSGKLPMTWPMSAIDHPSSLNFPIGVSGSKDFFGRRHDVKNYDYTLHSEGINVGYRYFDTAGKEVSYPFGYGLSYTTFAYSKPTVKATKDGFEAIVTVTNTGSVAGKDAVQLYVTAPASDIEKPARELKAFAKTRKLAPGESQTLTFRVDNYSLASYHESNHSWVADKGVYNVQFGASVADLRAAAKYTLGNTLTWETNDIFHPSREL